MDVKAIIAAAKPPKTEKAPMHFTAPLELKQEFDRLCQEQGADKSLLLVGMVETLVAAMKGIDD
jgi:hypothetical protein